MRKMLDLTGNSSSIDFAAEMVNKSHSPKANMKRVTVKWFHILKGFGEGVTDAGDLVLLKLTAVKPTGGIPTLQVGQVIGCEIVGKKGAYSAKTIDLQAFPEKKRTSKKSRPQLRVVDASR